MYNLATKFQIPYEDFEESFRMVSGEFASIILRETDLSVIKYSAQSSSGDHIFKAASLEESLSLIDGQLCRLTMHIERTKDDRSREVSEASIYCFRANSTDIRAEGSISGKDSKGVANIREILKSELIRKISSQIGPLDAGQTSESTSGNGRSITNRRGSDVERNSIYDILAQQQRTVQKVFISYSHDNEEHKQWVSKLAGFLNSLGIWVHFDQWDVNLGSDLHQFMNNSVQNSDRILVVCTDVYNNKVQGNEGGAAYERMLMTPELFANTESNKIIPIVRGSTGNRVPFFLGSRVWIDFSDDDDFDSKKIELHKAISEPGPSRPPFAV